MIRKSKHIFEYLGIRLLAALFGRLSLGQARKLGRLLGRFTFDVLRIRRRVTLDNLSRAFPQASPAQRIAIARATYEHFGMVMAEYLRVPSSDLAEIFEAFVKVENAALLEKIQRAGNGGIFLTAHFGNWEYAGGWLGYQNIPMRVMVQEQSNPYVDRFFRACRERLHMPTVPRGRALRSYLQALKQGHFVVMLADQDAGREGVFLDFLGQKASTATGPARFHLKTGAPILLFMTYRDANEDLHMHIEELPLPAGIIDKESATREIMQAYNRAIEKWIRKYPHHWFWMHRRWKTRPAPSESIEATIASAA